MVCSFYVVFVTYLMCLLYVVFFFQAEDGIRDLVRSRGLGDVYKRQVRNRLSADGPQVDARCHAASRHVRFGADQDLHRACLLYTSDAADERSSVDLGGRRIINKKKQKCRPCRRTALSKNQDIAQ